MKIGITAQVGNKDVASFKMDDFELPQSVLKVCIQNHITPIILPETTDDMVIEDMLDTVDGVIITGGSDVGTALYGEQPLQYDQISCMPSYSSLRDQFELKLIKAAVRLNKPILGICRGIQIINVTFGGTLYQDISTQFTPQDDECIQHFQIGKSETPTHKVFVDANSELFDAMGKATGVNSYHHQAIKTVGHGLHVVAKAPDGLVEGIESDDVNVQAIQWHPEQLWENYPKQLQLFKNFFKRCANSQARQRRLEATDNY